VKREHELDPRFIAGIDLIGRTGARQYQVRYSDDELPVVWFCVAIYGQGKKQIFETAAAADPVEAVLRLCTQLIDGAQCTHCKKATVFYATHDEQPIALDKLFCNYQWDPELKTFRRSCEGDT
jgi:hypothetical protein